MSSGLPDSWLRTKLGDVIDYGKAERAEPSVKCRPVVYQRWSAKGYQA